MTDSSGAVSAPALQGPFREVFRRHAAGVAIITATYEGRPFGFTATSVASLSADPPRFSFNMARTSSSWPAVANTNFVGVHMMSTDNEALADRFARSKDRFSGNDWSPGPHSVPVLHGVAGWLIGRISMRLSFENNAVVVAEVVAGDTGPDGAPLLYHGGSYGTPAATDYVI
ncbi:flavin reductase family protein [Arthrobacter sp. H41]|uniref:flavin reductase family protein n=1 Tax=Arthrobacter sp. H41 TaxID=1312978 RepID=UPI0004790901|nr:flavin reductase family protein [Arthrobacter sp. H41]